MGVEWDDASRGKHSGCHEGTQYFTCRYIPHTESLREMGSVCVLYCQ